MILYPAIDLKDGQAVRLLRGDMEKSTVFNATRRRRRWRLWRRAASGYTSWT